jgi:xanthine dehydrogenase YagT iron-sulfur-binding subunit
MAGCRPFLQAGAVSLTASVNGVPSDLAVAGHETLLDVLRDRLRLTGSKKGCDQGACGAWGSCA